MGYDYNAAASTGDSAYNPTGPAMPLPPEEPRQPRASLSEIDYRGPGNQPPGQHVGRDEEPPDPARFTYPVAEPTRAGRSQRP